MKTNCTACSETIDKNKGYYLVMGTPYCTKCYQTPDGAPDVTWMHPVRRGPENLLEAFRAYQKRSRTSACRSF